MKKRILVPLLVVLALVGGGLAALSPAGAEKLGPGRVSVPGFSGYVAANGAELGVGRLGNGVYGVCLDTGPGLRWPSGTPRSHLVANPRAGYLTATWLGRARHDGEVAAALWWAMGGGLGLNSHPAAVRDHIALLEAGAPATYRAVSALHDRMLTEARRWAPSPRGYRSGALTVSAIQVGGVGVVSGSGHWVPRQSIALTVTGATFADGGHTWHGTSADRPRALAIRGATGKVAVTERVTGLPSSSFRLYDAGGATQRIATAAGADTVTAHATHAAPPKPPQVPLTVTKRAEGDDPAGLVGVRVEVHAGSTTGPLVDAHAFVATDLHGGVAGVTFPAHYDPAGHYVAVITAEPSGWVAEQPVLPATRTGGGFGVAFVDDRIWQPRLVTTTQAPVVRPGTALHDTVVASGTGGDALAGEWRLLGPVPPGPRDCGGLDWRAAPIAGSGTIDLHGDGTYVVGPVVVARTGCYTWSERLAGDATTLEVPWTAPGLTSETTLVRSTPALATQVSHRRARAGARLADRVRVSGLGTDGAGPIPGSWRLLGPLAPLGHRCAGLDWSAAPVAASGTLAVTHDGTIRIGRHRVRRGGCYTYQESLTATPTSTGVGWTRPGIAAETAVVTPRQPRVPHHPQVPAGGSSARRAARVQVPHLDVRRVRLSADLTPVSFRSSALTPPADLRRGGLWRDGAGLDATVGTTVVVGHVSDDHDRPGVFHRLDGVRRGDGVVTTAPDGTVRRWRVTRVRLTPKRVLPAALFAQTMARRLVLITCGNEVHYPDGGFHYRSNLVVEAVPR
jgi:hypothetical protein